MKLEEDYILPDDYTEESQEEENTEEETVQEPAETVESTEDAPEQTEVPAETPNETPFLVAKYNKAEIPLDADSARNLAQLGMFYQEKIQPEYEKLKGIGEQFGKIEKLAQLYGMTPDELHESLYNQYIASAAESEGITPEQKRKEQELAQKEAQLNEKFAEDQKKEQSAAEYKRFVEKFSDEDIKKISKDTWLAVSQGEDLVSAYQAQLIAEQQAENKQLKQLLQNKQTSPAVATTSNGGAEPTKSDDFLAGLFGD